MRGELLFEKFRIIECLKKDAYNSVYIADHVYLDKKILLKTLHTANIDSTLWVDRFKREAKILAKLDHPNIIKVLDFGRYEDTFYISFEYFASQNLREILTEKHLINDQKRTILIQLADGLAIAHQSGIVHRDIKPENILIDEQDNLKIADFGLAVILNESILTSKSSIVGTPSYMSPEQIRGENLTAKSDLFSLGIVAYELFCGHNPFIGKDINTTINNILDFDERLIFKELGHQSPEIAKLISGLLHKNKEDRLNSAQDILKILKVEPHPEKSKIVKSPIRSRLLYISAVFAGLIIFTILLIILSNKDAQKTLDQDILTKESLTSQLLNDTLEEKSLPVTDQEGSESVDLDEPLTPSPAKRSHVPGRLIIESIPQVEVYIDSQFVGITPLKNYITIREGSVQLELIHPDYPIYQQYIKVEPDQVKWMKFNLDSLFGFLNCNIYPWGEVYIDGALIGQSPFQKPIILMPGHHIIIIQNPKYYSFTDSINVAQAETTTYRINLEQVTKKRDL